MPSYLPGNLDIDPILLSDLSEIQSQLARDLFETPATDQSALDKRISSVIHSYLAQKGLAQGFLRDSGGPVTATLSDRSLAALLNKDLSILASSTKDGVVALKLEHYKSLVEACEKCHDKGQDIEALCHDFPFFTKAEIVQIAKDPKLFEKTLGEHFDLEHGHINPKGIDPDSSLLTLAHTTNLTFQRVFKIYTAVVADDSGFGEGSVLLDLDLPDELEHSDGSDEFFDALDDPLPIPPRTHDFLPASASKEQVEPSEDDLLEEVQVSPQIPPNDPLPASASKEHVGPLEDDLLEEVQERPQLPPKDHFISTLGSVLSVPGSADEVTIERVVERIMPPSALIKSFEYNPVTHKFTVVLEKTATGSIGAFENPKESWTVVKGCCVQYPEIIEGSLVPGDEKGPAYLELDSLNLLYPTRFKTFTIKASNLRFTPKRAPSKADHSKLELMVGISGITDFSLFKKVAFDKRVKQLFHTLSNLSWT